MALAAESIRASILRRLEIIDKAKSDHELQAIIMARSAKDPVWWFNNFCWTFNPKNVPIGLPAYLPFDLFPGRKRWCAGLRSALRSAKRAS